MKKLDLSWMKEIKINKILLLIIAGLVNSIGVTCFIAPVNLYDSGVSGTSILLSQITPLTLSMFLLILNIPLFLFGLKRQGAIFTLYAIVAVASYSFFAFLITDVLPIDVSVASPLAEQDLLLCALFGGIISGIGSGLAIRFGGAMDGVEVMAVSFAEKLGISVGTFMMIYNIILYVICGVVNNSWILPLYSIVTYFAGSKALDFIVEGLDRSKAATIITSRPDEVCWALSKEFKNGMTMMQARGFFSGDEKTYVYLVLHWYQITKVRDIVHKYDPKAFVTISEVANVFTSKEN